MIPKHLTRVFWRNTPGENYEQVTFASRDYAADSTAGYSSYTLPRAIFLGYRGKEDQASGLVRDSLPGADWEVYQESLDAAVAISPATGSAPPPKVGDRITRADATVWQVESADLDRTGQVWTLSTRRTQ